jgi:CHASE2 domain-containing sensor protein
MNDKLDQLLKEALGAQGDYDAEKAQTIAQGVIAMYENKLKVWGHLIWQLLIIDLALIVGMIGLFIFSSSLKVLIGSATIMLLAFLSSIFMRLWYWQIDTKYSILKEITEMKLQLAQLQEKESKADSASN